MKLAHDDYKKKKTGKRKGALSPVVTDDSSCVSPPLDRKTHTHNVI